MQFGGQGGNAAAGKQHQVYLAELSTKGFKSNEHTGHDYASDGESALIMLARGVQHADDEHINVLDE